MLFLVDRTSLAKPGARTPSRTSKLENLQSFTEIYDVKELGDLPGPDTTAALRHRAGDGEANPVPR